MKNKYILLTFLFVFLSLLTRAQYVSDYDILAAKKDSLINQLRQQKIDTIITYKYLAAGYEPVAHIPDGASRAVEDSLFCEIKDPMHIIWISQGKTYISQLHPCFRYKTEILDDSILDFIKKVDLIKAPPFKPFEVRHKKRLSNLTPDHIVYEFIAIILGKESKKASVNEYALKKDNGEPGEYNINVNYESNQKSPWNLFAQTIATAVKSVKFKKDN